MFQSLDRLSEDDDAAVVPVEIPVFITDCDGAYRIAGHPESYEVEGSKKEAQAALRRILQRKLDGLRNSEAAAYLHLNHAKASNTSFTIALRVPQAIAHAVSENHLQ